MKNKIYIEPNIYDNINSIFNYPSPSSVVLNNCNMFNTTEFNIENKILKAKLLNIDKNNTLYLVFSCTHGKTYNIWKCKLNLSNNKVHNKIIKSILSPIINRNVKIQPYNFIKGKILLIDIFNDYNNPSEYNMLSSKIIQAHNSIIKDIKERFFLYKIHNKFCIIINNISNFLSSIYGECMIDYLSEEYINKIIMDNK
tara:strand:+ start:4839 stop:5432 length:594 start_codon:yes stop_codon:yes gene_type:complete